MTTTVTNVRLSGSSIEVGNLSYVSYVCSALCSSRLAKLLSLHLSLSMLPILLCFNLRLLEDVWTRLAITNLSCAARLRLGSPSTGLPNSSATHPTKLGRTRNQVRPAEFSKRGVSCKSPGRSFKHPSGHFQEAYAQAFTSFLVLLLKDSLLNMQACSILNLPSFRLCPLYPSR